MAQRRVNVKAVGIILTVLVAIMGSITVAKIFLGRKNPEKYIALAQRYEKEGNFAEAAVNYKYAIDADPKNIDVRIKFGDLAHNLARIDEGFTNQDRKEWDTVLTMDPTNKEALQRMMRLEVETVEFRPDPQSFTRLHELSEKILKLPLDGGKDDAEKKKNAELKATARAYLHISVIASWFADITQPDEVIRDNTDALDKLVQEDVDAAIKEGVKAHPINPDLPYYLGTTYVKQARELRNRGEEKEAAKLERRAYTMFDKVISAQPKGAVVRLRFSQVLRSISDSQDDDTKDDRQEYIKKMHDVLEDAHDFVKPNDVAYTEVSIFYANFLARNKDIEGAERVLRELTKIKTDDQSARLQLAYVLQAEPGKREEAIELLKRPVTDTGDGIVLASRTRLEMERETLHALVTFLIDAYNNTSDPGKRTAIAKDMDDSYQKLVDKFGVSAQSLRLKGTMLMVKGGRNGSIEAIPKLEEAKEMTFQHNKNKKVDWDLEYLLARAYNDSNQTGVAKQKLWDVVNALPQSVPPRIMLAGLLIQDHEMDLAREIVTELKRLSPGDSQVERLERQIVIREPTKLTPEAIDKGLKEMPESTADEIRKKVTVAFAAGRSEEGIRLLELLRSRNATDIDAIRTLAQIYASTGKKDLAVKITDEALAKMPDNISLQLVRAMLDNNQEKVTALTLKGIEGISKPIDREMNYYDYYNSREKREEALKHLDAAEKLDPESVRIMDIRFVGALTAHNWELAAKYVDRLAVKNADEAHGLIYRYRLALARGDFKTAEDDAREMVKSLPQFAQSWLCYGEVLKEQRKFEDAVNKFQNALQKQSENFEAYRGLIECYFEMKKPEEAKRYIEAGLKTLPDNSWLKEQQIGWELSYGDPTKALAARQATADRLADSLGAQLANGAALWQVAQYYTQKNKPEEARKYVQLALDKLTAVIVKWPDDKITYAYLADIYIFKKDFAGGEKLLKDFTAREKVKSLPDGSMMLGDLYARFGKIDLAGAAYTDALSKVPNRTDAAGVEMARKIASFFAAQHQTDKALKILESAAVDRRVQQQMIETLMGDNKLTEASQMLEKFLQANPTDPQFLATRGFLLMMEKKIPEALVVLDKTIELEPRNQVALYYRGMIRMRQAPAAGALDAAIKDLSASRDAADDPGLQGGASMQVQTRVALAEAFRANNQIDDAVHELTMCVQAQPYNKEIRVRLIEMLGTLAVPRWTEVERLIADARKMKEFEKDPDWPRLTASMWVNREKPDKALDAIREAIQLAQGDFTRTLSLMQDYLNILAKLKKYREMLSECDSLLKNTELGKSSWWIYQSRAIACANLDGKRADAMADFDKALEISGRIRSDDATAMIIQSIADTIGQDQAILRCEREANKGDKQWSVILTYLYFAKKDYAHAQSTIEGVLAAPDKLKPAELETAYGVAGSVYMLTGEYRKAEAVYQKLLALKPGDTTSLNNLACLWADLLDTPDPVKALTYSTKAMNIMQDRRSTDSNVMDTHGWVLTCNNRMDEGISFLQAAIDNRPMMESYYHLGVALLKKNLAIEAQQQLERARKMLEEKKNKGQPTDAKMEANLNEALVKARQLVNSGTGVGGTAPAPVVPGTKGPAKP